MSDPGGREFALLGHPVGHSLSPAIHRAAFEALDIDARYRTVDVDAGGLEGALRAAARRGGGNVTLPHKRRAAELLDEPSRLVRATGACNCFWPRVGGGLAGENTDVQGFLAAVGGLMGGGWPARRVLLLGAGGAAAAVLAACLRAGAGFVDVLDRTPRRARAMARRVGGDGSPVRVIGAMGRGGVGTAPGRGGPSAVPDRAERPAALALPAGAPGEPYDLVVNATSVGLAASDPLPVSLEGLGSAAVLDLVYGEHETAWVREARERGQLASDGLAMLVEQAAASLTCWLGVEPPREVMREAAHRAAGRTP